MVNTIKLTTSQWWPYLIFAIGTLAGASGPILLRLTLAEGVPTPVITSFRLVIAAVLFTPLVLNRYSDELKQLRRQDIWIALIAGTLFAIQFNVVFESYRFTSVLVAGVLVGSAPLWTALIERFGLHVRLGRTVWIGLFIALAGGALIGLSGLSEQLASGPGLAVGAALALTGAVMGAVYLVVGRSLRRHVSFIPFVWLVFSSAAVVSVVLLLLGHYPLTGYSGSGYFWILMSAIFPQIIAHGAFNYVLAYLPATLISLSGQMTGVLSAGAAFFIFSELPGPFQIAGSAVIAAGVSLVILGQTRG